MVLIIMDIRNLMLKFMYGFDYHGHKNLMLKFMVLKFCKVLFLLITGCI